MVKESTAHSPGVANSQGILPAKVLFFLPATTLHNNKNNKLCSAFPCQHVYEKKEK